VTKKTPVLFGVLDWIVTVAVWGIYLLIIAGLVINMLRGRWSDAGVEAFLFVVVTAALEMGRKRGRL
jgi:hypothetical protein